MISESQLVSLPRRHAGAWPRTGRERDFPVLVGVSAEHKNARVYVWAMTSRVFPDTLQSMEKRLFCCFFSFLDVDVQQGQ